MQKITIITGIFIFADFARLNEQIKLSLHLQRSILFHIQRRSSFNGFGSAGFLIWLLLMLILLQANKTECTLSLFPAVTEREAGIHPGQVANPSQDTHTEGLQSS